MKIKFIAFAIAVTALAACNNNNNESQDSHPHDSPDTAMHHHDEDTVASTSQKATVSFPVKEILTGYLQLKNALANDNAKDAATAGNSIVSTLATADMKSLSEQQMKSYMDMADDLKENAEHIGANAGKIDHQREHFEMLSKDIADFVKTFGNGGQVLYKDFCPMANDGKGAIWISELKEIKNPYLGSKMPTCGTVKEELK